MHEAQQPYFSLTVILALAVLEELIFRGYLIQYCHFFPGLIAKVILILTVIVFGISHASFGLLQMVSKAILGCVCTLAVLLFHTILPALIIHGYLNWAAFRCQFVYAKR